MKSTCCGSLYTIDKELGKDIERGYRSKIDESDLQPVTINYEGERHCRNCNYPSQSEYEYCPKCGMKL